MSRNGAGTYSLPSGNPVVSGTTISSTTYNNTLTDIANALTASVASDGQTAMAANLDMGSHRVVNVTNGASAQDAATYGQLTSLLPTGTLLDYAGTSAPSGFLLCDGSEASRTTNAALFAIIGTTWGAGNGSTTFNVPDLRRRTTIGSGGTAVSGPANTVGATGGEETHVLTVAELAAHNHVANDPGHNHTVTNGLHSHTIAAGQTSRLLLPFVGGGGNYGAGGASTGDVTGTDAAASNVSLAGAFTGVTINNNGSSAAHNNMQPSAVVTKIIKT